MERKKNKVLIELNHLWTIILNFALWPIFQIIAALIFLRIPLKVFNPKKNILKIRKFEKKGIFYERYFFIKKWKGKLPDGSKIFGKGFVKKNLLGSDYDYLSTFIFETGRAEYTHLFAMLPAPVFFIWNPWWAGIIMIIYAVIINVPCILAQRYNRARLEVILINMRNKKLNPDNEF